MSEKMAREEEVRRKEAEELKNKMDSERQAQGNSITQMFDRLKVGAFLPTVAPILGGPLSQEGLIRKRTGLIALSTRIRKSQDFPLFSFSCT